MSGVWLGPAGAGHHLITLSTERGAAGGGRRPLRGGRGNDNHLG